MRRISGVWNLVFLDRNKLATLLSLRVRAHSLRVLNLYLYRKTSVALDHYDCDQIRLENE